MKRTRSRKASGHRRSRKPPARRRLAPKKPAHAAATAAELREIESLRADLARISADARAPRWNANPDDVGRSVVKLVLTLVELIRQLLERQAIRRMEARTLTRAETDAIGLALMRLEETIRELAEQFDLDPEDLNLDLGPIGRLM
jgi:hypothetical protein